MCEQLAACKNINNSPRPNLFIWLSTKSLNKLLKYLTTFCKKVKCSLRYIWLNFGGNPDRNLDTKFQINIGEGLRFVSAASYFCTSDSAMRRPAQNDCTISPAVSAVQQLSDVINFRVRMRRYSWVVNTGFYSNADCRTIIQSGV